MSKFVLIYSIEGMIFIMNLLSAIHKIELIFMERYL